GRPPSWSPERRTPATGNRRGPGRTPASGEGPWADATRGPSPRLWPRSVDRDRDRNRDGHVPGRVVRARRQGVRSRGDLRELPRVAVRRGGVRREQGGPVVDLDPGHAVRVAGVGGDGHP